MIDEKKFQTARTQALLETELDLRDRKYVEDVEKFGCHVVRINGSAAGPSWAFTFGVYDTCCQPEVLVVGLKEETAMRALNYAVDALRKGIDLATGRHREIVGEVEVVFRPVDPNWVMHLMGYASWFNDGWDFPVLQLIYPDLENRFQWDKGFTEYFRQPLLQKDAPMMDVEKDFKASSDPQSSLCDWKFPDPPHTTSYLSRTVHESEETVTYVSHDANGDWQFLGDLMSEGGGPVLSCLHHPIDKDESLKELADLPLGWVAERSAVGAPWVRREHEADEEDQE